MRILTSLDIFYAYGSLFTLLRHLTKSHEVHAVSWGPKDADFNFEGIKLHQRNLPFKRMLKDRFPRTLLDLQALYENLIWENVLEYEIRKIRPNLVLTQLRYAPATVEKASFHGIPCILFIRSYEHFCPIEFIRGFDNCEKLCRGRCCWKFVSFNEKRLLPPFTKKMLEMHGKAIRKADLVLANSFFVKGVVKSFCDIESEVIYPFIDLDDYEVEKREPWYISFVRPAPYKGGQIVIEIAKALPSYHFLVCAGGSTKIIKELQLLKNVQYVPWVKDMREIYSRTWLMLIPSVWPEPFGRVAVEAMVNGIPCVASNRGGLPEAVGDAGILIDDIFDIKKWVDSIHRLENVNIYETLSKKARQRAQKFEFRSIFEDFRHLVIDTLDFDLSL